MPYYAILRDDVVDVIVADSEDHAAALTGAEAFETTGQPWVGWTLDDDGWRPPQPFDSWSWDADAREWVAPIPRPTTGRYFWADDAEEWVEQSAPFASWEWNGEVWAAPIAYPEDGADYYWDEQQGDWVKIVEPEPQPEPDAEPAPEE